MTLNLRAAAAASGLLIAVSAAGPAFAQKSGGTLRMYGRFRSDPAGGMAVSTGRSCPPNRPFPT